MCLCDECVHMWHVHVYDKHGPISDGSVSI